VGSASEQSLGELLNQLEHSDNGTGRIRAAESIARYGERAVPPLRKLLHHRDGLERDYACLALVRLGPAAATAVPDLMEIAGSASDPEDLRETAILALGEIGPAASSALPVLQAVLRENHPELRRRVVSALVTIATPEAMTVLIQLLEQGDMEQQKAVLAAFWAHGGRADSAAGGLLGFAARHPKSRVCDRVFLTVATFGRHAAADLASYLQVDQPETRRRAALALSRLGPDAAATVPALCEALKDESLLVRFWAAKALGNIGPDARQATASLVQLLDDADPNVRWEATNAIAKIDLAAITQDDRNRLLADPDPGVRQRAAMIRFANR
jgi:HEAT repeat protein